MELVADPPVPAVAHRPAGSSVRVGAQAAISVAGDFEETLGCRDSPYRRSRALWNRYQPLMCSEARGRRRLASRQSRS